MARIWTKREKIKFEELWTSERDLKAILKQFPDRSRASLRMFAARNKIRRLTHPILWFPCKRLAIDNITLSWLAGFLDADGTMGLYYTSGQKNLHARVGYINTDLKIIQYIRNLIGSGGIRTTTRNSDKQKTSYQLQFNAIRDVGVFLSTIIPFLKLKKKRAKIILKWVIHKMNKPRAYGIDKKEETLYKRIRKLNKRGPA